MMGERTYIATWEDPQANVTAARALSGLDFLQAIVDGRIPQPPIAKLLNYQLSAVSNGRVVFTVTPAEYHYNPIGTVHGGLAATLLDSAMACAFQSTLPENVGYTTIELHINYIRAITDQTGPMEAIGTVIHTGRRMGTAEGKLVDAHGKLYAHGSTTCMVLA